MNSQFFVSPAASKIRGTPDVAQDLDEAAILDGRTQSDPYGIAARTMPVRV
jgi:hypothetical protein